MLFGNRIKKNGDRLAQETVEDGPFFCIQGVDSEVNFAIYLYYKLKMLICEKRGRIGIF